MTVSLSFDHAVLVVEDLNKGISRFEDLGFTVTPGGVHAGGRTHNALIGLGDGTYLELVAATRHALRVLLRFIQLTGAWGIYPPTRTTMGRRFLGLIAAGSGIGDYALRARDLGDTILSIRGRGLLFDDPVPGSRMRPDRQVVSWRTSVPQTNDLPFLIEDITPLDFRLPVESARDHQNETRGVAKITVLVPSLEQSAARYQALLGSETAPPVQTSPKGTRSVVFPLGESTAIELLAPSVTDAGARRYLASRDGRPLRISLTTRSGRFLSLEHASQSGYRLSPFS